MTEYIQNYLSKNTKAAPLAVFRILFGFLMFCSITRFWYNGWIEKLYLEPSFHFHYRYFEWVSVPGKYTYIIFIIAALSALLIAFGCFYRWATIAFFVAFTYIELMDKTTYLNHYYFISLLSFVLIFLPANRYFSVDSAWKKGFARELIPRYSIDILKFLLIIVYVYAGLAKLNYDWLFRAMPLTIWLPTKFDIPLLGSLMHEKWLHFAFSWGGAIYDLFIVFFLMYRRTRVPAFIAVVVFHLLTRILFPIGMFPYVMIFSALIFFSAEWHERFIEKLTVLLKISLNRFKNGQVLVLEGFRPKALQATLFLFCLLQVLLPLRFMTHSGNVFWTEAGYRFSWRVMLMEKTGYATFKVVDKVSGKRFYVQNDDFLTTFQEKQMSTQLDFMIEYAEYLADHFENQGHKNLAVYVDSYASLNGRASQAYVKSDIDLLTVKYPLDYSEIINPLHE